MSSSIILKDDDGNNIHLNYLKHPIDLSDLVWEYETDKKQLKRPNKRDTKTDAGHKIEGSKSKMINVLTEPLSLEELKDGKHKKIVKYKVKASKNVFSISSNKSTALWKQNAITIFEYSYVYPFIHAFNKYKCFVCTKVFLDPSQLKDHSQEHDIKEFKRELNKYVREKNVKVDVTALQCKICTRTLQDINELKIHLKEHGKIIHLDIQDNIIPFKLGGNDFQCQICNETYSKLRLLIIHMGKHFNNYSCEHCGNSFISFNLLKSHIQTHKRGYYPCEKCDKVFNNAAKRSLHFRGVHLKQFLRTCPICPERFNSNYQRAKHLRLVHNQNTELYKCETCGREYDLKYSLIVHKRAVHMQEKNQECSVCHARFFSKYCLSRHMMVHTGEKKFKCDVCGKMYARVKSLRDHLKSHETRCTICGRVCNDQASLTVHMNTHNL